MKKILLIFLIFTLSVYLFFYLTTPKLENHYHLEWGNKYNKFQIWNIDGNRMKINEEVCSKKDTNCFYSRVYFSNDKIHISPWVDSNYSANYEIDEKGIIYMINEYQDRIDTLKLVPHHNCITSKMYFKKKLKNIASDFRLTKNGMMNFAVLPSKYENELIIGVNNHKTFILFNNKLLKKTKDSINYNSIKKVSNKSLWVYVDERIKLKELLPALKSFYNKGYIIHFMSEEIRENNEQVNILKKSIANFKKLKNGNYTINSCEYCDKYPNHKIDSILKFKILGTDSCKINNKTTNFFQLRNHISRSLIKNRTTRLNSEIQLEIDDNLLYKDYLELLNEIDFVNTEISSITYYHGKNDPDQEEILKKQNQYFKDNNLEIEFPLRIKEIITSQ